MNLCGVLWVQLYQALWWRLVQRRCVVSVLVLLSDLGVRCLLSSGVLLVATEQEEPDDQTEEKCNRYTYANTDFG